MKYAIIGAGWAGCSAAVELAKQGHQVHVFEASRTLGGRARAVISHGLHIDNGQHILLGAYQSTLALLKTVGVKPSSHLLRLPLQICYPTGSDGMQFIASKLPAPFHMLFALFSAKGLAREDKIALARFTTTVRWMDWQLNNDCTVSELLARFDQTENLIRLMWQPLCVSALNTPLERASAQIFLNVLRDSLGVDSFSARRAASDMLIARTDLTRLLPQPVADFIQARGGQIHLGCHVQTLIQKDARWQLGLPSFQDEFDGVVIATQPEKASKLLASIHLAHHIPQFEYEPITTCYLQYSPTTQLLRPFFALKGKPEQQAWGQFVFDRRITSQAGLFAVVISASHQAIEHGHEELALHCASQLATDFKRPELATPEIHTVITEKHATFSCTPNLKRPTNQLPVAGLVLAGDYTESRYPATLETAVQSGALAAKLLLRNS